jgi:hypothetical protein
MTDKSDRQLHRGGPFIMCTFVRHPDGETTFKGMIFPSLEVGADSYSNDVPVLMVF